MDGRPISGQPNTSYHAAYSSDLADGAQQKVLDYILNALGYQGPRPKRRYMCHCPAHDDRRPSLSVAATVDGRIFIHCFAGCSTPAVLNAIGLSVADLYPRGYRWYHRNQLKFPFYESIGVVTPARFTALATVNKSNLHQQPPSQSLGKIVARYIYRDAQGQPLCQVVRFEPKDFRAMRYVNGRWYWGLGDLRPPLYRLPQLLAAPLDKWVFVVEGEKDVERLMRLGLTATCNIGGAGKWRGPSGRDYAQTLAHRRVCLIPDNDEAGRRHAATVAAHLQGIAAAVHILELPGLPAKGDVSDWLALGGHREQLLALLNQDAASKLDCGLSCG
jgi:hypothetical protein